MKKTFPFILGGLLIILATLNGCSSPTLGPISETTLLPHDLPVTTPDRVEIPGLIVVTNASDDGSPGTLRNALSIANERNQIVFASSFFQAGAQIPIYVEGEMLPPINHDNITISALPDSVVLNGSHLSGDWDSGLQITNASGVKISGLEISRFSGPAISIGSNSHNNVIEKNRLTNNAEGVSITSSTSYGNTIKENIIGIDLNNNPAGNSFRGLSIIEGAHDNIIGPGNQIAFNGPDADHAVGYDVFGYDRFGYDFGCGVLIEKTSGYPDSDGNWITRNSIHDNKGNGICLVNRETEVKGGPNEDIEAPFILSVNVFSGSVRGISCADCTVEVFSNADGYEGQLYEGRTLADSEGMFDFQKPGSFGQNLGFENTIITTTATDGNGNTSEFSRPGGTLPQTSWLQEGNTSIPRFLPTRPSRLLADNKIGLWLDEYRYYRDANFVFRNGFKRIRIQTLVSDDQPASTIINAETLSPKVDYTISQYADNGVKIQYFFGSKGSGVAIRPWDLNISFQTQEEIEPLLEFVDFVTKYFKDRFTHYEVLNEPGYIDIPTYVNVINQTVPVIRRNDENAKIEVNTFIGTWVENYEGYGTFQRYGPDPDGELYFHVHDLFTFQPGVLPSIDGLSWHPIYDNIPGDRYYKDYPDIVNEIKDLAAANGFSPDGEYFADEILWTTVDQIDWDNGPPISPFLAAKYYLRTIIEHRAMDFSVTFNPFFQRYYVTPMAYLANIMAGAEPANNILLGISPSPAMSVRQYAFTLPSGEKMIALWTNGNGTDETEEINDGITAQLRLGTIYMRSVGYTPVSVTAMDVLHGYEQVLVSRRDILGNLIINNFKIKDFPIILRFNR